jgi:outer membrane protein OmpA-like peptidoglycan-associated protein
LTTAVFFLLPAAGCSGAAKVQETRPAAPKVADADADSIPDASDLCANAREDGLPPKPNDGCPARRPEAKVTVTRKQKIEVTATEVKLTEKILFASRKATIDPASDGIIRDIATVLNAHPEMELIEVAGHADNQGADRINLKLTNDRAQAVVKALVGLKVNKARLRAVGYGRYCPLVPNEDEKAREKNRRVEFKIVRVDGKDTGAELGCSDAAAKGIGGAKR